MRPSTPSGETKGEKRTFLAIFLILAVVLMFMPLLTTFNDVLTRIVISLDFYRVIERFIVPWEVRMVGVVLAPLGFNPTVVGEYLLIGEDSKSQLIEIVWNCVGWQSLLFFVFTAWIGLQGNRYTLGSKLKAMVIGLLGTFLVNLFRIALVTIIASSFGQFVATIFHDYGSTLAIILWLFAFWWFTYAFVLQSKGGPSGKTIVVRR